MKYTWHVNRFHRQVNNTINGTLVFERTLSAYYPLCGVKRILQARFNYDRPVRVIFCIWGVKEKLTIEKFEVS